MRPDKKKVVDEVWDDDRIRGFLNKPPMGNESPDYSVLLNAYRSMRPEDFTRFLTFYADAGRDLEAASSRGLSLAAEISAHRGAGPFLAALRDAGAVLTSAGEALANDAFGARSDA